MKINVKVIPNSSKEEVKLTANGEYRVYIHAKPIKGEANKRAREVLCEFLGLPKHKVILVSGKTAKVKVFEIK